MYRVAWASRPCAESPNAIPSGIERNTFGPALLLGSEEGSGEWAVGSGETKKRYRPVEGLPTAHCPFPTAPSPTFHSLVAGSLHNSFVANNFSKSPPKIPTLTLFQKRSYTPAPFGVQRRDSSRPCPDLALPFA